jgi:hypothetical protein
MDFDGIGPDPASPSDVHSAATSDPMTAHASLRSRFPSTATSPGIPIGRFLTPVLIFGVVLSGVAYAYFAAFSGYPRYDDEGVVLLFVQHLLDGHAIYDRVNCLYGPFYLFARWVVFGVFHVPVDNDALRAQTFVTWLASALLLAMTAWRLARNFDWRAGVAALVGILAISQLFVLPQESGHPQEMIALCVAAALLVTVTMEDRRTVTSLMLLGGIGAALLLTKINVGIFYFAALGISLLALTPPDSVAWLGLKIAAAGIVTILPWLLMKSRFGDGYGGFCYLVTSAILPCAVLACVKVRTGTLRLQDLLLCGLGAGLVVIPMLAFTVWQGNTLRGMADAIFLRTYHSFASAPVGVPLFVSGSGVAWSTLAAALAVASLARAPVRVGVLWPLRLLVCAAAFSLATTRGHNVITPIVCVLPLMWLLLVPPAGRQRSEREWFLRLFLAFTACLQPLQIFPVTGSQKLIGTLVMPVVAVVLALDLCEDVRDVASHQPLFFASRAAALKRLALIAIAIVSLRPRSYQVLGGHWTLPSATSVCALVSVAVGLIVLRYELSARKYLWPLKLVVCGGIAWGIVTSPPWDMTWLRFALPLCWLILVPSPDQRVGVAGTYVRLGLILGGCLELLGLLPVVHFVGWPFHFAVFLMIVIGAVLLHDLAHDLQLVGRSVSRTWPAKAIANTVLLFVALLCGSVAMIDAEEAYRQSDAVDLPGCRWIRMPERDAAFCTFLATNVRHTSDCVFARFGLESLHFWAEQRPASDVVPISNLWAQMDPVDDERLLRAHRNRMRMLFIDNLNPWNPVPPKMQFLDFVSSHFQLLGRVGHTRLLVRKERTDLALYDCAFQRRSASGGVPNPTLFLRLPTVPKLQGVATVELVDLARNPGSQVLKSTAGPESGCLKLIDNADHLLLPAATGPIDIGSTDPSLRIVLPEKTDLTAIDFPALRFLDTQGRRTLTLPVVVDAADAVR